MKEPLAVLRLPYDPAAASPNRTRGRHWSVHDEAAADAHTAAAYAHRIAGDPVLDVPVCVEILVRRGQPLDEDNLRAALKPAADFLFARRAGCGRGRMLPDDSPKWLVWGAVRWECGPEWSGNRSEVILVIWAREEAEDGCKGPGLRVFRRGV